MRAKLPLFFSGNDLGASSLLMAPSTHCSLQSSGDKIGNYFWGPFLAPPPYSYVCDLW